MAKRIVLINQASGYLFIDIVNTFSKEYDEVVLFAGLARPLESRLAEKVKVVKIPIYNRSNTFTRVFSWITGFISVVFLLKTRYQNYEVFASTNPPFLNFLPLLCRNKISLLVYDLFPDGLTVAGFITETDFIYKKWVKWNIKAFRQLQTITTLTPAMSRLLSQYTEQEKIKIIPAWSNHNIKSQDILPGSNEFINKNDLQNKFLVVYSGNIAKGYDIERIVHLAQSLKEYQDIQFLIIGEGYQKDNIQKLVIQLNLQNCLLLPFQPTQMFGHLLSALHVGIVSLEYDSSEMAIPSKLYNLLGAGKPIVCLGSEESDLGSLISQSTAGTTFPKGLENDLRDFVIRLASDKAYYSLLSQNAYAASQQFTYRNAELLVRNHLAAVN